MLEVSRLARAPLDSARFGLEVWRATEIGAPASVLPELVASGADVAIYRLPPSASGPVARLAQSGLEVIHAGVLVYYTLDLTRHDPPPPRNPDIAIVPTTAADDAELAALVDASFGGYASHYLANPLFAPDRVLAGYREWTLRHRLDHARTASWVARRDGRLVAFACCAFDAAGGVCDGGIYGVLPGEARSGLFGALIRHTQRHFKDAGFREMRMSSKADNFAVQKVWMREGFHLYAAFDTLHVNALLSAGAADATTTVLASFDGHDPWRRLQPAFEALLRERAGDRDVAIARMSLTATAASGPAGAVELSLRVPDVGASDVLRRAVAVVRDGAGTVRALGHARFDAKD